MWNEFKKLRTEERFLKLGKEIQGPVIAIHGDYDPHLFEGIKKSLSDVSDFRTVLLPKCGHYPWQEKHCKNIFYIELKKIIDNI